VAGVVLFGLIGWQVGKRDNEPSTRLRTPVTAVTHVVEYFVTGTATTTDITYSTADGSTGQQAGVDVPLAKKSDGSPGIKFAGVRSGAFLYISAQNGGESGTIVCEIAVDGVTIKHVESSGGYTIATCSAVAP